MGFKKVESLDRPPFPFYQEVVERVAKDRGWRHPRAPVMWKLWRESAMDAVLEFLAETGSWVLEAGRGSESTRGG